MTTGALQNVALHSFSFSGHQPVFHREHWKGLESRDSTKRLECLFNGGCSSQARSSGDTRSRAAAKQRIWSSGHSLTATMASSRMTAALLLVAAMAIASPAAAFYLPGVAPQDYARVKPSVKLHQAAQISTNPSPLRVSGVSFLFRKLLPMTSTRPPALSDLPSRSL